MTIKELEATCKQVRRDIINMTADAGSGHPGGSLSATEILVALYFDTLKIDPTNPKDPSRDRFVLSKGMPRPGCMACWAAGAISPWKNLNVSGNCTASCRATPI